MQAFVQFAKSSIGRKYLMGLTGLALVLFVIGHLIGNLQLLLPDGVWFNLYAKKLHDLGPLLWVISSGLIAVILIHSIVGWYVSHESRSARPERYDVTQSKGGPSRNSIAGRGMLYFGGILLVFIVLHIIHFKFGAWYTTTTADGKEMRDLFRLVVEEFQKPWIVLLYSGVMVALGFHLRHGIWSMLQSLGVMPRSLSTLLYSAALIAGVALAVGFIILPVWIYIDPFGWYDAYLAANTTPALETQGGAH